jgi:hypothetical protein
MSKRRPRLDKRDPALLERVRGMIASGMTNREISDELGIAETTFYKWKRDWDQFSQTVKEADDEGRASAEAAIKAAWADGTWQAAAWWLERKWPHQYGRYTRTELSGPQGGPVRVDVSRLTSAEIAALLSRGQDGDDESDPDTEG